MPARTWTNDDPRVVTGQTNIKAAHITEVRQVIDTWRSGQSPPLWAFRWTDTVSGGSTPIKAIHFNEIRLALRDGYEAKPTPTTVGPWTAARTETQGPGPMRDSPIFAQDLNDLRQWYEQL